MLRWLTLILSEFDLRSSSSFFSSSFFDSSSCATTLFSDFVIFGSTNLYLPESEMDALRAGES